MQDSSRQEGDPTRSKGKIIATIIKRQSEQIIPSHEIRFYRRIRSRQVRASKETHSEDHRGPSDNSEKFL